MRSSVCCLDFSWTFVSPRIDSDIKSLPSNDLSLSLLYHITCSKTERGPGRSGALTSLHLLRLTSEGCYDSIKCNLLHETQPNSWAYWLMPTTVQYLGGQGRRITGPLRPSMGYRMSYTPSQEKRMKKKVKEQSQ